MKCRYCGIEMLIDRVSETENTQQFFYKCPNPACPNYGYGDKKGKEEEKAE